MAATVVAYLGTGGAALVVREAAELGEELIGYTREVLTVSAMATLGHVLRPRIEALVVGDEIGGSTADAYAMRELVTLHDRLGAEATATVYNMLWSERWRNSSSLAGIAKGAGLTLAEWLTADADTKEVFRDEAAWRVRRVREGAAFAAAMPQLLAELEDRYVGPPETAVEVANDGEGTAADRIAPEWSILFSEDFESYDVGSRPAHYIIVHDGLGTSEQRIEAEGGNRHLRTAGQRSWSLHMREDFDFDLPDVLSVTWRMRVDLDQDRYDYTLPDGILGAVVLGLAVAGCVQEPAVSSESDAVNALHSQAPKPFRDVWRQYISSARPFALALALDGSAAGSYICARSPCGTPSSNPEQRAIRTCERASGRTPGMSCDVYALGRRVVWDAPFPWPVDGDVMADYWFERSRSSQ